MNVGVPHHVVCYCNPEIFLVYFFYKDLATKGVWISMDCLLPTYYDHRSFVRWNSIRQEVSHLSKSLWSSWSFLQWRWCIWCCCWYSLTEECLVYSVKSFMKILKTIGPRTEPFDTPNMISTSSDTSTSTTTCWVLCRARERTWTICMSLGLFHISVDSGVAWCVRFSFAILLSLFYFWLPTQETSVSTGKYFIKTILFSLLDKIMSSFV